MSKLISISIGGATEDLVVNTQEGLLIENKQDLLKQNLLAFEQGSKIKIDKPASYFGGGASNSAVNFSGLGFKARVLLSLSNDERSKAIVKNLKNKKVDCSLVDYSSKKSAAFSFVLSSHQDRIIFTHRGSNDDLSLKNKNLTDLKKADLIYVSSLAANWENIMSKLLKSNPRIYWNPGLPELASGFRLFAPIMSKIELLILNKDEALELIKSTPSYSKLKSSLLNNVDNIVKVFRENGVNRMLLTDGSSGAYYFTQTDFFYYKAKKINNVLDVTGVGDAFASSFVAFFISLQCDYKKALFLAGKNAQSVISSYGAQNGLLNLREILK